MLLNLPVTIEGSTLSPRSLSYLHNYYNINSMLFPREGYEMLYDWNDENSNANWEARGLFVSATGSKLYAMFSGDLHVITGGFPTDVTGSIAGSPPADGILRHAVGFTYIMLVSSSAMLRIDPSDDSIDTTFSGSKTLVGALDVAYIDGRYVYIQADGELVWWSEVNDPMNIDALSFFDAESRPDLNKAVSVIANDLFIYGDKSIERFRHTGTTDAPFVRVVNSVLAVGYIGGMIKLSDRNAFIGRSVGAGVGIYELSRGVPTKISNPAVDELLNVGLAAGITTAVQEACLGQSWDSYGRPIYAFSFRTDTAAPSGSADTNISILTLYCMYDDEGYKWGFLSDNPENAWANEREWGIQDLNIATEPGVGVDFKRGFNQVGHVFFNGAWHSQRGVGKTSAGIYRKTEGLSASNQSLDVGAANEPITRGFRTVIRMPEDGDNDLATVEVSYSKQGAFRTSSNSVPTGGDSSDVVTLRTSQTCVGWGYGIASETEGKDWSSEFSIPFGNLGDQGRAKFQKVGGLGHYNGALGIIVESDADIPLLIEKVIVK